MTETSVTQNRAFATPPVDIFESKESFKLVAELPGVSAEGIKISFEQDELTLEAARADQALDYRRRFSLALPVDVDSAVATLDKGVLHLELPKAASAKPRAIPVQTG